jgi:hypothetical protein
VRGRRRRDNGGVTLSQGNTWAKTTLGICRDRREEQREDGGRTGKEEEGGGGVVTLFQGSTWAKDKSRLQWPTPS